MEHPPSVRLDECWTLQAGNECEVHTLTDVQAMNFCLVRITHRLGFHACGRCIVRASKSMPRGALAELLAPLTPKEGATDDS